MKNKTFPMRLRLMSSKLTTGFSTAPAANQNQFNDMTPPPQPHPNGINTNKPRRL